MKKRLFSIVLCLLIGGLSAAAGNRLSKEGYVGNVSISLTPQLGLGVDVTTSHGYSFGNGFWMGGGLGVSLAGAYDGIFIPIFVEAKYSFMTEKKVSPFVDSKLGFMTDGEDIYAMVSPTVGVDINSFSVFAIYNVWSGVRTVNLGFAYNF